MTAVLLAATTTATAAPGPPPPPGHIGFEAGGNSPVTVGLAPVAIAVGDLDGDGHQDFATADGEPTRSRRCTGTGSAASRPALPSTPVTTRSPSRWPISTATRTSTSRWPIAAPTRSWVLLQLDEGDFTPLEPIPSGGDPPTSIAVGRMDANDSPDLVVANSGGDFTGPEAPASPSCSTRGRASVDRPRLAAGDDLRAQRPARRLRRGRQARPLRPRRDAPLRPGRRHLRRGRCAPSTPAIGCAWRRATSTATAIATW